MLTETQPMRTNSDTLWKFILVAIISITFIIRLYISFISAPQWYATDSYGYIQQATSILSGDWDGRFPNGYPLVIAAFAVIFGDLRDPALIVLNCVLWSAAAIIIFVLFCERTIIKSWGCVAALIVSLWPTHFIWSRSILTEAPTAFFLTCGMALIWFRHYLTGAFLIGVCLLIRPTFAPLILFLAGFLLIRDGWKSAAIVVFVALLPQAAVATYADMKSPDRHSTHLAEALVLSQVHRKDRGTFVYGGETTREAINVLINNITSEPANYLRLRLHFANMLWGPWPERQIKREGSVSFNANVLIGLQFPLIVFAIYSLLRRRDSFGVFLLLPALVVTTVHVAMFATSRYNVPVVPLVSVLAADGVYLIYTSFASAVRLR